MRRLIGREALVVGILGGVPGALAGIPASEAILHRFVSVGAVSDTVQLTRSPFPPVAAALVTCVAGVVAARASARRIGRISPADALGESTIERRGVGTVRVVAGLLATVGAVVITSVLTGLHSEPAAMPVTYLSALLWLIAATLLGPLLVRVATTLLAVVWRVSPVGGFLAAQNAKLRSRRVAAAVSPLALLIGMAATIVFVPLTLSSAAHAQATEGLHAEQVVRSDGPGVPDRAVDRIRNTHGVTAACPSCARRCGSARTSGRRTGWAGRG